MRRGENHGQGADTVLDVLVAPIEDRGRRLRIGGAEEPQGEPHQDWGQEKTAEEVGHPGEYEQGQGQGQAAQQGLGLDGLDGRRRVDVERSWVLLW